MTSACRCFGNPVQRYSKKKEQRKIATPLLLVLLDCYCGATGMLLVIVLSARPFPYGVGSPPLRSVDYWEFSLRK